MSPETPLDELLLHYEEFRAQGQSVSPEKLCSACPEILGELQREIQRLESLNALLWVTESEDGAGPACPPGLAAAGLSRSTPADLLSTRSRYRVLRSHAQGGLGEVVVARDEELHREVALKLIQEPYAQDAKSRSRFLREAELTGRLEHPNIVPVYALGQDAGGRPFYVMRLVGGETLHEAIQRFHKADQPHRAPGERRLALRQLLSRYIAVCNTIAYAHSRGILHRDIKPGNIVLGKYGETLVIDWGLAKPFGDTTAAAQSDEALLQPSSGGGLEGTHLGEVIGTPAYMSPEQAAGRWDLLGPASDVYSLGATLYMLLTGRSPVQGSHVGGVLLRVQRGEFPPPRQVNKEVSRALEAICLKAMALRPEDRYAKALDLATDLEHWLADEPVGAWREPWWVKTRRWLSRHRTLVTAAVAMVVVLTVSLAVATVLLNAASRRESNLKELALRREEDQRLESLVGQGELVRFTLHSPGWSNTAWQLVGEAAGIRKEGRLRNEAAATLAGIDAHEAKVFEGMEASSVAFDRKGERLLLGGCSDLNDPVRRAKLWDADWTHVSKQTGAGPVTFGRDGAPLQLTRKGTSLLLWNVAKQEPVAEYRFAQESGMPPVTAPVLNDLESPVMAMTPDGSRVAAATGPDGKRTVAVWEGAEGRARFVFSENARALALSPQEDLLATGAQDGRITVRSITDERKQVTTFHQRAQIHCLTFSADAQLLAAGDSSGTVTIWDLKTQLPLSYCRGSQYDVYAVAFSPDGTILASGGRGTPKLWDVATGGLLLNLSAYHHTVFIAGLAFSPDARKLVISCRAVWDLRRSVTVWELEYGRGIQTLHGFSHPISHVCFSPDDRWLAALVQNWQIGIWERETGRLWYRLPPGQGISADNAALAFSPNGSQFAFSAGTEASLWDLRTGNQLDRWELPEGGNDALAFHPTEGLLLLRHEGPALICRNLKTLHKAIPKPPFDNKGVAGHITLAAASLDGNSFMVTGRDRADPGEPQQWWIKVFDPLTGNVRWSKPLKENESFATHDPEGRFLAIDTSDQKGKHGILVEMPSGNELGPLNPCPRGCLSPAATYLVGSGPADPLGLDRGWSLFRQGDPTPLLVLGTDTRPTSRPRFNVQGNLLAWGNSDGTVTICDLPHIHRRLAELGLEPQWR